MSLYSRAMLTPSPQILWCAFVIYDQPVPESFSYFGRHPLECETSRVRLPLEKMRISRNIFSVAPVVGPQTQDGLGQYDEIAPDTDPEAGDI